MSTTFAVALAIGLVLLGTALTAAVAYRANTLPARPRGRHTVHLRAQDAADFTTLPRPGDDDQWWRLRTAVPHIRRRANEETQASQGES